MSKKVLLRAMSWAKHQWLTPVIPATQEAEIRRIVVQSHIGQIVQEIQSQKYPKQKKKTGGVAQGVHPEFKPLYHTHTKKCYEFYVFISKLGRLLVP
jgi:hypothetical protein